MADFILNLLLVILHVVIPCTVFFGLSCAPKKSMQDTEDIQKERVIREEADRKERIIEEIVGFSVPPANLIFRLRPYD